MELAIEAYPAGAQLCDHAADRLVKAAVELQDLLGGCWLDFVEVPAVFRSSPVGFPVGSNPGVGPVLYCRAHSR